MEHFASNFNGIDNDRFDYICRLLVKNNPNNKIELVTSSFNHEKKKQKNPDLSSVPYKVTILHEKGYPTNICLQRFKSHYDTGRKLRKYLSERAIPDVIYCGVPSLSFAYVAAEYANKHHVRFIIDIQDLWPEAFRLKFNIPIISDAIFTPFNRMANYAYAAADEVVAVSQTYADRAMLVNRKCKKPTVVFLGTNFEVFDKYREEFKIDKPSNELWIGYVGTLGASYDITVVSHAIAKISNDIEAKALLKSAGYKDIVFQVMGDGPKKKQFKEDAEKCGVNANFTGRLDYPSMVGRLCACDLSVNPINHGAAQSIINKVGDYAAAGLGVINTLENREYRKLVHDYHCGINCKANDIDSVANGIKKWLSETKGQRAKMGINSRKLGEDRFDREKTYRNLIQLITE